MVLTLVSIRPFRGLVNLTLGGIRPLCGLVSLTLVGSVHFVVIILVVRTQHGLECFFIRFKAVEKSICPLGLKKILKEPL